MLDAFEAEMLGEGEGREGEEGALGDDGEELLPASSLQPSSSPRPPPPPPPKSCSKSKGTPVSWLAFASNDETQGGMGRIRVLAFEMVSDADTAAAADDDGDDGKKPHPSSPFPLPLAPRPFHPWRATVVAHVRCPRERVHALAALPDGGLAAAIERRLALLDVAAPPTPAAAAEAEATRAAMARITASMRSRHRGPDGRAAMAAVERAVTAAMEAAAAGAARAPTSHPLSSAAAGDRRLRIPPLRPPPGLRGSLRARAVCRLRAGGDSAALSLRVLPAPTSTEPVSSSSGAVTSVIAVADGGNGPQRGGRSGCSLGGGGVGVSLFAVTAGPPPRPRTSSAGAGDDTEDDDAPPRRGGRGLLRPIAACSTPWAAAAVVPVAWPHFSGSGCFRQDFGAVGGDALGGRLFALAPPPPLFRDGRMLAAAAAAVNPERCLSDAAVGRMGGGSRVTCAMVLSCDDGDGDGERRRRRKSPERSGDDPLSSKKRKCREGLFLPSSSSSSLEQNQRQLQHQQRQQQQQQCSRRHPTWLFGNDAGALLAVRQVPRELGAALLLIQAALESGRQGQHRGRRGAAAARGPPLAEEALDLPPSPPPQTGNKNPWRPFYPPWASVVADAAGREAAAAVLAAHADSMETETEAGEARVGGGEGSLAAAAEAAVAAASMPPLSPRGVSTALAAALAAVAGGNGANRGNGSSGTGNNNSANSLAALAPAPASSAEAPAPFPPLSLPAPEEMDDHGSRARDETAMRVAMRAFEGAKRATLAAIADGSHPLAERALRSSSSPSSPSSQAPSSSSLPPPLSSSPPQFLDGDVLAAFFELPIPRRREVLDRLGSGGAVVAALALAAAGSGSNSCRPLAAAALRAAANAEAAAEVVWNALEGLL